MAAEERGLAPSKAFLEQANSENAHAEDQSAVEELEELVCGEASSHSQSL